ncbi:MAG: hypothetical protein ACYC1C_19885 [Chloroflexota bacterium]
MMVREVESQNIASSNESNEDRKAAIWATILALSLMLSPLAYDLWALLGGS